MKKATIKFNSNIAEHVFRFDTTKGSIKVTNVYVHSPNEGSLNKQSIEWTLNLKPFLKATFINGSDSKVQRIDISTLENIYYGRPRGKVLLSEDEQAKQNAAYTECKLELEYDHNYPAPEISVDVELSAGVLVEEVIHC